jgi:large subunit ribosomal protein L19
MENTLDLKRGSAVKVYQKISEGKKERIIAFQGKIIKSRGESDNKMLTVRQFVDGVDVDRVFPVNSPVIIKLENIEVKKKKPRKKSAKRSARTIKKTSGNKK